MNKQVKVLLLWGLAIVAISTVGVSGCREYDPDLIGAWRLDHGGGCYEYLIFTDSGTLADAWGNSACGEDNGYTGVATYTVNTSVTPHQMDIAGTEVGHVLAVYEVSGDTLKIASSEAPNPRPTGFTDDDCDYCDYDEFVRLP